VESKNKIIALVDTAINAASDFQQSSKATRSDLNAVFDQLKKSASISIEQIEENAEIQNTKMKKNLLEFSKGMEYHSKMQCELDELGSYVNTEANKYREDYSSQEDMIGAQKVCFDKVEQKHKSLQEQLIKNITDGVHVLINEETKKQTDEMKEQFDFMTDSNRNVLQLNGNINTSVTDILTQVGCANKTLTEHVNVVQENDVAMKNAVEDATETLEKIQNIAKENHDALDSFGEKAGVTFAKFDDHEETLAQARIAVEEERDDVSEFVSQTALACTRKGLSELGERERELTKYVTTTIISNTGNDMETTQSICKDSFTNASERVEQLKIITQQGKSTLESIVDQQCLTSDNLNQLVNSKGSDFITNGASARQLEIEERRKLMITNVEQHAEVVSTNLSETKNSTNEVKSEISTHSKDVICMDEEEPPVEDRKIFEFKDSLSSTPSTYQIYEASGLHLIDEEDSVSYINEDDNQEGNMFPISTKQENNNPMSPLSEISMNSTQVQHFTF